MIAFHLTWERIGLRILIFWGTNFSNLLDVCGTSFGEIQLEQVVPSVG